MMTKVNKIQAARSDFEGFHSTLHRPVGGRAFPSPTLYRQGIPFLPHPTEGIIFPYELIIASWEYELSVGVPATDLPISSLVDVYFKEVEGPAVYKTTRERVSSPDELLFKIPREELRKFEGKKLTISYNVHLGNDSTASLELPIRVTTRLMYDKPVVEGLENGDIIVGNYPDGLDVELQPIKNIAFPSIVILSWEVMIVVNDIPTGVYSTSQRFDASPEAKYLMRVPKEAYTGWPKEAYGICSGSVDFTPHDPRHPTWGTGGHKIRFI